MKVMLINPPDLLSPWMCQTNRPPYDLLYIDSFLQRQGVETVFCDIENQRMSRFSFLRCIFENQPTLYVVNTTGRAHHFRYHFRSSLQEDTIIRNIVADIRSLRGHPLVFLTGETAKTYIDKYVAMDIDGILYDDPEFTLDEIVSMAFTRAEQLRDVKGIYYKHQGSLVKNELRGAMKTLDELPPPCWERLPGYCWESAYRERRNFIDIVGMRGCQYSCVFCKSSHSRKVLRHSPAYLLREIRELHERFGYSDFFFRDAGYFDDENDCAEMCAGLGRMGDIIWKCNARIDRMTEERLRDMRRAGCTLIAYGVESANDCTLHLIKKGISTQQISRVIHLTKKAGIRCAAYCMYGLPGEGLKDYVATSRLVKEWGADILYFSRLYRLRNVSQAGFFSAVLALVLFCYFRIFLSFHRDCVVFLNKVRVDRFFRDIPRHVKNSFDLQCWRPYLRGRYRRMLVNND